MQFLLVWPALSLLIGLGSNAIAGKPQITQDEQTATYILENPVTVKCTFAVTDNPVRIRGALSIAQDSRDNKLSATGALKADFFIRPNKRKHVILSLAKQEVKIEEAYPRQLVIHVDQADVAGNIILNLGSRLFQDSISFSRITFNGLEYVTSCHGADDSSDISPESLK